jgi:hypothetical protein
MRTRRLPVTIGLMTTVVLVATGCSGKTIQPSGVGHASAVLRAEVSCPKTESCSYRFKLQTAAGKDVATAGLVGPSNFVAYENLVVTESKGGLLASTAYRYQVCGNASVGAALTCVGPDGTNKTWTTFTTCAAPTSSQTVIGTLPKKPAPTTPTQPDAGSRIMPGPASPSSKGGCA